MQGALLEVAERTDPGRDPDKQINEDSALYRATKLGHLLVVCDGMGGHALGREASQLAVSTIAQSVETAAPGAAPGIALANAVVEAGRRVYQMGGSGPQVGRPGSTCVALLVHGGAVEVAHVGDSRAYFIRNGHIWPLTKDHSVVQQLLDQGAITPEQAVLHPEGNKITRALGMKPDTEVELREPPLLQAVGDIFVLATDGLCDLVRTEEIGAVVMQAASLDLAGQNLIAMANARGGHDNITVLLARVLPGGAAGATVTQEPVAPTIVEKPGPAGGAAPGGVAMGAAAPGAAVPGGAASGAALPEKTLVDRPPMGAPPAATPFAPSPAPFVAPSGPASFGAAAPGAPLAPSSPSGSPATPAGTITEPLHAVAVPPGPGPRTPTAGFTPRTIPPAPPSRSGMLIAVVVLVVLFLGALVVWSILRSR